MQEIGSGAATSSLLGTFQPEHIHHATRVFLLETEDDTAQGEDDTAQGEGCN